MQSLYVQIPISDNFGEFFKFGTQENSLGQLITILINLILTVSVITSLIFLLVGGIKWITSGHDKTQLEEARNQVLNSIIGLVIAMAAWAIWLLFVKNLFGLNYQTGINLSNPNL